MYFLENDTSTVQTAWSFLAPGEWQIMVELPASQGATIEVFQRRRDNANDTNVSEGGAAISLTEADPAKIVTSAGEEYSVKRTTGASGVWVSASRVPG